MSDFLPREFLIAAVIAAGVQGGAVALLRSSSLDHPAPAAADIDVAAAIPIKAVSTLDLGEDAPLLKLGGEPDPTKLPDLEPIEAPKARVEEKAFASTKAGKTEVDIPPPDVPVAPAGTPPPPPDAEITKKVDAPITPDAPPIPPANVSTAGHQDGVKGGTETDPLKARAVDLYRARIIGWFSRRFRVSGSGLSPEELTRYRVSATVQLSEDRQVMSYSIVPSGNPIFDAAASKALEGAKGESLPQPPENYPDVVQRSISLTFVCKEKRCD